MSHPSRSPSAPHRVAILAFDGVVAFDLAVPATVFGTVANEDIVWASDLPSAAYLRAALYDVRVCAAASGARRRVRTADGFAIEVPYGLDAVAWADTVVVPGVLLCAAPLPALPALPPRALAALRAAHARGARIVSVCTGAFVLAAAGLLDGRRAATHWAAATQLAADYPQVAVDPAVLYVVDGAVCTSAGVAAGIDLCLHLVREDHGAEVANAIARGMVVAPHRSGGQAQFAETPVPARDDGSLEPTRRWMLAHLAEPLTVDVLARHASVSRRTFARRFAAETGTTPLQWLVAQRVLLARQLLETTDEPVARVAALAGFGDALGLRQHFGRATGTTPLAYRQGATTPGHPVIRDQRLGSRCADRSGWSGTVG
jgi:transcriptional regulator GlxA family with amidase domain